jgi:hypothetical protein
MTGLSWWQRIAVAWASPEAILKVGISTVLVIVFCWVGFGVLLPWFLERMSGLIDGAVKAQESSVAMTKEAVAIVKEVRLAQSETQLLSRQTQTTAAEISGFAKVLAAEAVSRQQSDDKIIQGITSMNAQMTEANRAMARVPETREQHHEELMELLGPFAKVPDHHNQQSVDHEKQNEVLHEIDERTKAIEKTLKTPGGS